eukprot:5611742-Pyramimonas_sp.AAC.1
MCIRDRRCSYAQAGIAGAHQERARGVGETSRMPTVKLRSATSATARSTFAANALRAMGEAEVR